MDLTPDIVDRLGRLEDKYNGTGQSLAAHLDSLLYSDYLDYSDYICLDALLGLQRPRSAFPDELIFLIYHQVTELVFRLCIHELEQLTESRSTMTAALLASRVARVGRYVESLTHSLCEILNSVDVDQFLRFRNVLTPSSGFQSVQFRMIEIYATDLSRLQPATRDGGLACEHDTTVEALFDTLYWKQGAKDLATGRKALMLVRFEQKYSERLRNLARACRDCNVRQLYRRLPLWEQQDHDLVESLRRMDTALNIQWAQAHFRTAARYQRRDPALIGAGGTNWKTYLPPQVQKIIFFPEVWNAGEIESWGTMHDSPGPAPATAARE